MDKGFLFKIIIIFIYMVLKKTFYQKLHFRGHHGIEENSFLG
jgi:hypothetical protein